MTRSAGGLGGANGPDAPAAIGVDSSIVLDPNAKCFGTRMRELFKPTDPATLSTASASWRSSTAAGPCWVSERASMLSKPPLLLRAAWGRIAAHV